MRKCIGGENECQPFHISLLGLAQLFSAELMAVESSL
jgi:hypothetical protein